MSEAFGQLSVTRRASKGKGAARQLRAKGLIPAVMYGAGQPNQSLAVDPGDLRKAFDPERRFNTFFHLTVTGGGEKDTVDPAIVTDYQLHPYRDEFVHVDFLRVDPEQEITTTIPVEIVGKAAGVAVGGKLATHRRTVRVAAKPAEIPVKLVVDVTPLNSGDFLRLSAVTLTGARLLDRPDTLLASIEIPKVEAEKGGDEQKSGDGAAKSSSSS
ncbi:MAG: 50S ribosomal protein L25 [Nannocystaceae bacterium]